jgi:hypothetical protein
LHSAPTAKGSSIRNTWSFRTGPAGRPVSASTLKDMPLARGPGRTLRAVSRPPRAPGPYPLSKLAVGPSWSRPAASRDLRAMRHARGPNWVRCAAARSRSRRQTLGRGREGGVFHRSRGSPPIIMVAASVGERGAHAPFSPLAPPACGCNPNANQHSDPGAKQVPKLNCAWLTMSRTGERINWLESKPGLACGAGIESGRAQRAQHVR